LRGETEQSEGTEKLKQKKKKTNRECGEKEQLREKEKGTKKTEKENRVRL